MRNKEEGQWSNTEGDTSEVPRAIPVRSQDPYSNSNIQAATTNTTITTAAAAAAAGAAAACLPVLRGPMLHSHLLPQHVRLDLCRQDAASQEMPQHGKHQNGGVLKLLGASI